MCFDSSSSSSSTQQTTTQNMDLRVVGGSAPAVSAAPGANVTVTTLDAGAVNGAFGFAQAALADSLHTAEAAMTQSNDQINQALQHVSDAYATAKAGEQKVLVAGVLALLGLVALTAIKGKGLA